jgi:glucose/arabinose dehydrogenase
MIVFLVSVALGGYGVGSIGAQENKTPYIVENASHITIERVFTGVNDSTNMAFLGPDDLLVLERESGKIDRIVNGQLLKDPLADVNTHFQDGLIGITTSHEQNGSTYVFLYFNEAPLEYNSDVDNPEEAEKVNHTLNYDREGDRLYRYKLVGNKLVDPQLLFNIQAPKPTKLINEMHHGGELIMGPDNALYLVIGNLDGDRYEGGKTMAQNYNDTRKPDGRAGILRVSQDGNAVGKGILGNSYPLNLYYAYGIRNSYGLDFDPVTGYLWDTENGPDCCDEINLVKPGFNSGADIVNGMSNADTRINALVDFDGKGKYSDPEFVWNIPVGPTALKFFNSDKFGNDYENDIFVADVNNGTIYHFDLNENRTELLLDGPLADKVADKPEELQGVIFARGFGGITDMQVGPDGYLYIVSHKDYYNDKFEGTIYRIVSKDRQ